MEEVMEVMSPELWIMVGVIVVAIIGVLAICFVGD
jgi:hypothetical protein